MSPELNESLIALVDLLWYATGFYVIAAIAALITSMVSVVLATRQ